jgi:formylglycine-generating enzyme required for sulfatase activity
MRSTTLLIGIAAAVALPFAESKSDEQGSSATRLKPDASDKLIGKEPGEVRDDNGLKLKLVWCPPGTFVMGSPETEVDQSKKHRENENQVQVTLTNGFWLGKYEVTRAEWKQMMQTEPWEDKSFIEEGDDFPVEWVCWEDATKFCRKLTEQERQAGRLSKRWEYTLPTEAQWEYACRAGTETRFSFGEDESKLSDYAWYDDNASKVAEKYAHRVGQKKANPWGLYDMHGNVAEFCRDTYTKELPGGHDPEVQSDEGFSEISFRVSRGGHWSIEAGGCRSAWRWGGYPSVNKYWTWGFRLALCPVR